MKVQVQLLKQAKRIFALLLKSWFIYLLITGLIIGVGKYMYNIPVGTFTREPNTTLNGTFYVGAFSNLGIILWTITATLCIFSATYLKRYDPDSRFRLFMLHAGILTTILLLDDTYMWHEDMFPGYLGIKQYIIYAIYFVYTLYFLINFRKVIFKTEFIILLASLSLMSLSVLLDVLEDSEKFSAFLLKQTGIKVAKDSEIETLLEDTFKGMGILTWLIYFARVTIVNVLPPVKNR